MYVNDKLAVALGPTPECVPLGDLVKSHVEGCFHCRAGLALFWEFESSAIRPDEQRAINAVVARLRKLGTSRVPRWCGYVLPARAFGPAAIALATVLVAAMIGLYRTPTAITAEITGSEVMRTLSLEVIAPLGDLSTVPAEFKWRAVGSARNYVVRLSEVDGAGIWSTSISEAQVTLPMEVRRIIVPRKTLLWEVTALDESGSAIARSALQHFCLGYCFTNALQFVRPSRSRNVR